MSDPQTNATKTSKRATWPSYIDFWRLHFYAGLLSMPIVIVLSITGTIYLFKPQIEAFIERDYDHIDVGDQAEQPVSLNRQIDSAINHGSGGKFVSVELPKGAGDAHVSATRVLVDRNGLRVWLYIHPVTTVVLGEVVESERFIRVVRRIHGELLLGKRGSYVVETFASWTIVMILSGLVLWFPGRMRVAGVLYPRIGRLGRPFWKDLHSVVGFWVSGLALFLIVTGLPWSTFWGSYFRSVRSATGTASVVRHWDSGGENSAMNANTQNASKRPIKFGGFRAPAPDPSGYDIAQVSLVASYAATLDLMTPVVIRPPTMGTAEAQDSLWEIRSETANRPYRTTLKFDAQANQAIGEQAFSDRHWIDQVVGQGIALHEGQRFGLANQLLALVATSGLLLLSASGVIMWWRRRSSGGLDPPAYATLGQGRAVSKIRLVAVVTATLLLAVYLPLFGATLVVVLLIDRFALSRVPRLASWFGRETSQ